MNTEKIPTVLSFVHAEADSNEPTPAVTFTKEQKDHINETFRERYKEIQTKARQELEAERAKWEADFEAKLEAKLAEKKTPKKDKSEGDKAEGDDENPQLAEYQRVAREARRQADEREKALVASKNDIAQRDAEILQMRKESEISKATAGLDFVNMKAVLAMTASSIEFDADSRKFIVKNDSGEIMQGDDFKPITLKEFFVRFADENPYLVKSNARGGAGSTPANGVIGTGEFAHIKTRADFGKDNKLRARYIEKYKMEKYLALPIK
jgi:hypothetical protein